MLGTSGLIEPPLHNLLARMAAPRLLVSSLATNGSIFLSTPSHVAGIRAQ